MPYLLALLGCPHSTDDGTHTDTDSSSETGTPTATTGDTSVTLTSCEADPSLAVQVAASTGPVPNQIELTVTTSSPAKVAATCTADADPSEVHLVEGQQVGTQHGLRFMGLLQDTSYTCRAVATCPESTAPSAPVTHVTGHASTPLPVLTVQVDPSLGQTGYWTLAPWLQDGCHQFQSPSWIVLWDVHGVPRWWWPLPRGVYMDFEVLYDPTTGLFGWGGGESELGAYNEIDPWEGAKYSASLPDWDGNLFSHDGHRQDATRALTLQTVDNHSGAATFHGFGIRMVDTTTDQVLFQLDSQRYLDEGALVYPNPRPSVPGQDPFHANWVQWIDTATGPELYVSLCYGEQILGVDGDDGALLWQLGAGLGWTVKDESGAVVSDSALPQCQHGLKALGDGDFLVYDNGQDREQSSAEEWHVDPATKTAQRTWYWTEPAWYEPFLGDIDDLGNGRMLITQAAVSCTPDQSSSRIAEVDRATGRVASRLTFPKVTDGTYRSQRLDGCALFSSVAACPALEDRLAELEPLFQ